MIISNLTDTVLVLDRNFKLGRSLHGGSNMFLRLLKLYEPRREKTGLRGFRPGLT